MHNLLQSCNLDDADAGVDADLQELTAATLEELAELIDDVAFRRVALILVDLVGAATQRKRK
jgi:hypothetical protein